MIQVTEDDNTITKITDAPIPNEDSNFWEIPKNEQSPIKRIKRMLLTKTADKKIRKILS